MTEPITFDIVLPYYSPASRALEAIGSVRAQSYPHWRLICVDDAYPEDKLHGMIEALGDDRITYLRNPENIGLAKNFARCLQTVRSAYFVMIGDDDQMHPDYLQVMSEMVSRYPDADVVQPGVRVINDAGHVVLPLADRVKRMIRPRGGTLRVLKGRQLAESLIRSDWAYFPSLMWKTDVVVPIGFDTRFAVALDYALLLEIALQGGSMLVFDRVVFDYRRHAASVSSVTASDGSRFAQEREFFELFAARFAARGWRRAHRIARRRVITRLNVAFEATRALIARDVRRAGRLAAEAVR